jgi:two-component system response regulator FixJ
VGYQPIAFARPAEFLAKYDANQAGCLVLDVRMPEMSGLEVQQQLNRNGALLPVILMTGHVEMVRAEDVKSAGARSLITKPCLPEVLEAEIRRVLSGDTEFRTMRGSPR